jgi:UDPglucose 6-dehydrogenase
MKIAIIGHGFVGRAVDYGFTHPQVEKTIIDPKYGTSVADIDPNNYDVIFVCVPTPMSASGAIDHSILHLVMASLNSKYRSRHKPIVIKSTVTPDILDQYTGSGIVYNPEFLREKTALEDFINPDFHVFGGQTYDTNLVQSIYEKYSSCKHCKTFHVGFKEASLIKYAINCFLATKVTFFNQLFDVAQEIDADYSSIVKVLEQEPRIGTTHMRVPGFDNKRGFGGACFPKDSAALSHCTDKMSLLKKVIEINNTYRAAYVKDERELAQNITYEKTN